MLKQRRRRQQDPGMLLYFRATAANLGPAQRAAGAKVTISL
jgi:hypothetical protein